MDFAPPAFLKMCRAVRDVVGEGTNKACAKDDADDLLRKLSGFLLFGLGDASDLGGTDKFRQHNYDDLRQMPNLAKSWKYFGEVSGFSSSGGDFFLIGSATPW